MENFETFQLLPSLQCVQGNKRMGERGKEETHFYQIFVTEN